MDADVILVPEGLALGVHRHQPQHRRVERVDALEGGRAGVRRLALVVDELDGEAVADGGRAGLEAGGRHRAVLHDADVDIVELAEADKLLLSAEEPELALLPQLVAVGDLHVLLGGDAHEHDVAVELVHQTRVVQGEGDRRDGGELRVVAAGVDRAGDRVRVRVVRHEDRVQLAHHGDAEHGPRALEGLDDAGIGDARPRLPAEAPEQRSELLRRLVLLEAELGLSGHGIGEGEDVVSARVDRRAGQFFQFFFGSHSVTPNTERIIMHIVPPRKPIVNRFRGSFF